jgi:hypothetical protein
MQLLVSVKICLYDRKLSIGMGICPILSATITCVGKNLPIHMMVLSGAKRNLFLKGTGVRDFLIQFF